MAYASISTVPHLLVHFVAVEQSKSEHEST